jgi:ribosome-binding factor A
MSKIKRMPRVDEILRREIAEYLERVEFGLKKGLVTVHSVQTAPDLKTAKVNVSILNASNSEREHVFKILKSNRFEIQTAIAKHVRLKYTPVLNFSLDESMEKGDRVMAIIQNLEREESPETPMSGKKEAKGN